MELSLQGKTALVTGGSKGIGKSIAKTFADAGAKVMITSRKADVCETAAAEIGNGCVWEAGNVGDPDHMEQAIDRCISELGGVDVLVNNAATNPYAGPMIDADLPRWRKTIDVNMTAPFAWTQLVWQKYQKDNGGVVLNISSVGGLETNPMLGVYDVTKAALLHMTKQLAAELAPEVRVNAICPVLIKTAGLMEALAAPHSPADGDPDGFLSKFQTANSANGSLPLGEDVGSLAVYLSSPENSAITGQCINVDCGVFPQ